MDTTAWLDLWGDHILRQYFVDMAKACSLTRKDVQEDLLATAWLAVGECECGCTTEYLMHVGFMAMVRRYKLYYWVPRKRWGKCTEYQRVARHKRRFFIRVKASIPNP